MRRSPSRSAAQDGSRRCLLTWQFKISEIMVCGPSSPAWGMISKKWDNPSARSIERKGVLMDKDAHIQRVRSDGFTIVENAISPDLIDEINKALDRLEHELGARPAN